MHPTMSKTIHYMLAIIKDSQHGINIKLSINLFRHNTNAWETFILII